MRYCGYPDTSPKNTSPKSRVSNQTWTRTVNPNEPFHFGEPEPNLNQQNFTSGNLNQTWTLKIVLKWTQTEPEPLTKVRIYFSISRCRWRWYTHNKSSGDHQQDQQFLLFFSISGRVDRASATEAVDTGSIPGRVKPKTIKIGIYSFPAWRSAIKGTVWSLHRVW